MNFAKSLLSAPLRYTIQLWSNIQVTMFSGVDCGRVLRKYLVPSYPRRPRVGHDSLSVASIIRDFAIRHFKFDDMVGAVAEL